MNPPIWLMAATAFTVGIGMRIIEPILPMLAAHFGTGLGGVAPLIGGFALAYGIGQFVMGPLGDRFGKMRVVAVAMAGYSAMVLGASVAGNLPLLLGFRIGAGFFAAAVMPLFMAHVADRVPYERRQAVLGKLLTGMVAAQLLTGPLTGIVADYAGWQYAFLLLGLMAAAMTALFVARSGDLLWRAPETSGRGLGLGGFLRILRKPHARRLMTAVGIDGVLLFGGAFPFIASLLIQRFDFSAAQAGLVVAGFGLGSLLYTRLAGWLVRRLGERGTLTCGGLGIAAALAVVALAPVWWLVAAAQAVLGLVFFMLHGVLQARATEVLPEARGTALACFSVALFLGQSIGAITIGTLIVTVGYTPSFLLCAAGVAAMTVWIGREIKAP